MAMVATFFPSNPAQCQSAEFVDGVCKFIYHERRKSFCGFTIVGYDDCSGFPCSGVFTSSVQLTLNFD